MSKLLVNLALGPTKALVNLYTWTTLPFYALVQKPWQRLRLSNNLGLKSHLDKHGRTVYSRPVTFQQDPLLSVSTLNEIIPLLDRSRKVVGLRDAISEDVQLDQNGNPIKVDGREFKKLTLANQFRWLTVGEILDRVDALARGLDKMGVKSGEKVLLFGENSLEWFCAALALQRINAVAVTLLAILNNEGLVYCINQCEARYLITTQDLLTKRIAKIQNSIQNPLYVIYIENMLNSKDDNLLKTIEKLTNSNDNKFRSTSYREVEENGHGTQVYQFPVPKPTDPTLIMYTSGTTGNPKGVILTHRQIYAKLHNSLKYDQSVGVVALIGSRVAAFLPSAHIIAFTQNLGLFIGKTGQMALCSAQTLLDSSPVHPKGQLGDFKLIQPELVVAVPLVLERILKEIYRIVGAQGQLAVPLFTYFMDYKIHWSARGFDSPLINKLICAKINREFGGKLKSMVVGSAPLSERTHSLVQAALNIHLLQGYGSTEMSGGSHMTIPCDRTFGACGVPYNSVKYYLKDWPEGGYHQTDKPNPRGEIVVGGDIVAEGYFKMEKETKESFKVDPDDGTRWFESGDIGELMPNGGIKIIDRKKDLIKLANGEFVSLGKIESGLRYSSYVENICVCTSPFSNHVTALITPNRRALVDLAYQLSKPHHTIEQLCLDLEIVQHIHESLQKTGQELDFSAKEIPATIKLVREEWSPENGLLTPAMKLKRRAVHEFYRKEIDQMFSERS